MFDLSQVSGVGKGAPVHLTADPLHSASPQRGRTYKTLSVWPWRHGAHRAHGIGLTAAPCHPMCWNVIGCFQGDCGNRPGQACGPALGAPWAWERTGQDRGLSTRGRKGRCRSRPRVAALALSSALSPLPSAFGPVLNRLLFPSPPPVRRALFQENPDALWLTGQP